MTGRLWPVVLGGLRAELQPLRIQNFGERRLTGPDAYSPYRPKPAGRNATPIPDAQSDMSYMPPLETPIFGRLRHSARDFLARGDNSLLLSFGAYSVNRLPCVVYEALGDVCQVDASITLELF